MTEADPTYPPEIKPFLYAYDEYQTYDLVYAEIKSPFVLTRWQIGIPLGFYFSKAALFERFTPWEFPWCEGYSTKFKNFLEPFTGSTQEDNPELLSYPFVNQYLTATSVTLDIPKGDEESEVVITWMEQDIYDVGGFFGAEAYFIKRYKRIRLLDKEQRVKIPLGALLRCSIVVSGLSSVKASIESQLDQLSKGYLYKNLDTLLSKTTVVIDNAFPNKKKIKAISGYKMTSTRDFGAGHCEPNIFEYDRRGRPIYREWSTIFYDEPTITEQLLETYPIDIPVPSWYKGIAIFYANNDRWANGSGDNRQDSFSASPFFAVVDVGNEQQPDMVIAGILRSGKAEYQRIEPPILTGNGYPGSGWQIANSTTMNMINAFYYLPALMRKPAYALKSLFIVNLRQQAPGEAQGDFSDRFVYKTEAVVKEVTVRENNAPPTISVRISQKGQADIVPYKYWYHKVTGELFLRDDDPLGDSLPNTEIGYTDVNKYSLTRWDIIPALSGSQEERGGLDFDFYPSAEAVPQPGEITAEAFRAICYGYYLAQSLD